jgi:hypothetical protein
MDMASAPGFNAISYGLRGSLDQHQSGRPDQYKEELYYVSMGSSPGVIGTE